jgi:hypothetical protein
MGLAIDHLRTDGKLPEKVGPYEAEMRDAIGQA